MRRGLSVCLVIAPSALTCISALNLTSCQAAITNLMFGLSGTLDANGNQALNVSSIVGYKFSYCETNCSAGTTLHDFNTISQQLTQWFLPWLTLLAQLPFVTEDRNQDMMVGILSIGSPTLALYSIFVTILNRKWIKSKCKRLMMDKPQQVGIMLESISEVLCSLQQFPMEIRQGGLLACTLAMEENVIQS